MKRYLPMRLKTQDQDQLNQILIQIQKIRISVNQQLDNIEEKVYEKIESLISNPLYSNLNKMEALFMDNQIRNFHFQLSEIVKEVADISVTSHNQITHKNEEDLLLLNFTPAFIKLSELQVCFSYTSKHILQIIEQNKKAAKQKQQAPVSDKTEIWKHKTFAKTGNNLVAFTFTKNTGTAESILPLQNLMLKGFYLTQLFKGMNQFDQAIDDQIKMVTYKFRVHEGIDLTLSIYDEIIKINHMQQQKINDCYFIELREEIFLKQGLTYTFSLVSLIEENFNTFMFAGKCVSFGEVKFLNKETENIAQVISVKQSLTQSCLPGFAFAK